MSPRQVHGKREGIPRGRHDAYYQGACDKEAERGVTISTAVDNIGAIPPPTEGTGPLTPTGTAT